MGIPSFKEFMQNKDKEKNQIDLIMLYEYKRYKNIDGTKNSYREDSTNVTTKTIKHAHVYAKTNGKGKELYSVNMDGSGHDGSGGIEIPKKHADYLRSQGYNINSDNILEFILLESSNPSDFELIVLED